MTEVGYASDKPSDCAYCYFFSAGRKKCKRKECFYRISSPPLRRKVTHWEPCEGCPYDNCVDNKFLYESRKLLIQYKNLWMSSNTIGIGRKISYALITRFPRVYRIAYLASHREKTQ